MSETSASGILEQAILPVKPGQEADFEKTFDEARHIVAGMPGFRTLTLSRGIETPSDYLLLIAWDTVEHHELGFRGSPEYQRWRELLHRFYEPFPKVEHFVEVASALPD
ncbi:antibiotic biosynthesis monooxygenase [Glaciihabitans sp. UYNi722]|uniref:antibiotic biosynthesis monooxygenase family protein n=1 Tax=Glaciihabitans sp. UYNi722 TaxID=3156344 RepID=UPI003399DEE1